MRFVGFFMCGESDNYDHWQQQFTAEFCQSEQSVHLIIDENNYLQQGTDYFAKMLGFNSHKSLVGKKSDEIKEPSLELSGSAFRQQNLKAIQQRKTIHAFDIHTYVGGVKLLHTTKKPLYSKDTKQNFVLTRCAELNITKIAKINIVDCISYFLRKDAPISITLELIDRYEELGLSVKQSQCFYFVLRGYSNREIAQRICLTQKTVDFHLANIKDKLKVSHRRELIELGLHIKLLYLVPRSLVRTIFSIERL